MTFDANNFSQYSTPPRASITNMNGVTFVVIRVGTMMLSPTLPLSDTLLVPSVSHKLLFVSQLTEEKCVVLNYSTFCLI